LHFSCPSPLFAQIKIGSEVFIEKNISLVKGKRIAVLCNSSSIVFSENKNLVDVLLEKKVNVTAIFSPEHGFRGNVSAGEKIENNIDSATRIKIYSLYGKTLKPTKEMFANVDVLLFDLQDAGARYFTYASTMAYAMESCIENKKQFILLDRPNPLGGNDVEGFLLEDSLKSFVGRFSIPNRHGLTLGELAKMIVGERWIENSDSLDYKVIQCENLTRGVYWNDTKFDWFSPSPNILTPVTAFVYAGTCLFEGTNVSEGRGTNFPFQTIGAPWIDGEMLKRELESSGLQGAKFSFITFIPNSNPSRSTTPKFLNEKCSGVFLEVNDEKKNRPLATTISLLCDIKKLYPDSLHFNAKQFDRLAGTPKLRKAIEAGKTASEISSMWGGEVKEFLEKRKKYLLYK